jgi:hypothetical protein
MESQNNKLGKFFGPSLSFAGYFLMGAGILTISYSFGSLALIIPGAFLAFTYSGTILDIDKKRVKPYIALFGIFRTGEWVYIKNTSQFNIAKVTKRFTSYSRANVRFDLDTREIRLILINKDIPKKVIINKFKNFEDAQREKEEICTILLNPEVEL